MADKKVLVQKAADALCNLNTWGAVDALLENSLLRPGYDHAAVQRVLRISHKQKQKHLNEYDKALARIGGTNA